METAVRKFAHTFSTSAVAPTRPARRHISPEAGRALEKLGHAIEYLTDEMVNRGDQIDPAAPDVKAVQILMALNRSIYEECPPDHSIAERCRDLLHRFVA